MRLAIAGARQRLGGREGDMAAGKVLQAVFVVPVKREMLHMIIRPGLLRTAEAIRNSVTQGPGPYKGCESTDHEGMTRVLETQVYFMHSYASQGYG